MATFLFIVGIFFIGWQGGVAFSVHRIHEDLSNQGLRAPVTTGTLAFWVASACFIISIALNLL